MNVCGTRELMMSPAEPHAGAARARRLTTREKAAEVSCALLSLACFAFLFASALGRRAGLPLHSDETYFARCAIRGMATGEVMAGCHDKKVWSSISSTNSWRS